MLLELKLEEVESAEVKFLKESPHLKNILKQEKKENKEEINKSKKSTKEN